MPIPIINTSTFDDATMFFLSISKGYGEWMLLLIMFQARRHFHVLDGLDIIWSIDNAVIRMLLNMRDGTHVLILAQSRTKPRAVSKHPAILSQTHSDTNLEWTESIFLSKLARLTREVNTKFFPKQKDIYDNFYGSNEHASFANHLYHLSVQSAIGKGIFDPNNGIRKESDFFGPLGPLTELKNNKDTNSKKGPSTVASGSGSLWFWDTPLPFVMAAINDCEKLFNHDPITIQLLPLVLRFDVNKLYFKAASEKVRTNHSMQFSSDTELLYGHEDFLKQNNVSTNKSIESFYFLHSKNIFNENLTITTPEILNECVRSADEYFDRFAAAYSLSELNCLDDHHAGTATERLEIVQIFNLFCNKHLKLSKDYCCA